MLEKKNFQDESEKQRVTNILRLALTKRRKYLNNFHKIYNP